MTQTRDDYPRFGVPKQEPAAELTHRTTSAPPPLGAYLADIWRRRDIAVVLPWMMFRTRDAGTALGSLWIVLTPAMLAFTYFLLFGILIPDATRGVPNVMSFIVVGVFIFQFIQSSIGLATNSVVANLPLIRTAYFPRALLPIQSVALRFYNFVPAMCVVLLFIVLVGERPTLRWLAFPALVVPLVMFAVGMGLISARINTTFRDWSSVLPFVFRMLLFTSSVIFPLEFRFGDNPDAVALFSLNPIFGFLSLARWALLEGYEFRATDLISV